MGGGGGGAAGGGGGGLGGRRKEEKRSDGKGSDPGLEGLQAGAVTTFSGRAFQSFMRCFLKNISDSHFFERTVLI